ncbi:DUF410-domain-containing protein [Pseudovirgaria hyperparasitica]|uniref:DUF410-domain-containing protein n=1 Tax=Pseudovirgaria hyperparasitica TaxID=470096 RepID=A0A6A6VZ76_9PEZI|nr:DUF410-domain-containing protein [Pseudovirgaria hyperparasitica]KAF2755978.1 DUF410-domain-containing protein [Pseudovirgaria hyperparasitica]
MSKIEKTIARQQAKIEEGQFYEAHQQLRVIASRYIKQSQPDPAISILYSGAQLLLKAGQGGSGGDLALFLLEVYNKSEIGVNAESKGRLITLMRGFPAGEPTRKRFINEAVGWSARFGESEMGDAEMHHVAGMLFAADDETYDAERHFLLGTRDSPVALSTLEYEWYTEDEPSTAPLYVSRAVLPYLLTGNYMGAKQSFFLFTRKLEEKNPGLPSKKVDNQDVDVNIYPSMPLLNFLGLLLLAVERGAQAPFLKLRKQYEAQIRDVGTWGDALDQIGERYFGVRIPKAYNPLGDMMNMFMGGGGGGGAPQQKRRVQAAAPAPGVD